MAITCRTLDCENEAANLIIEGLHGATIPICIPCRDKLGFGQDGYVAIPTENLGCLSVKRKGVYMDINPEGGVFIHIGNISLRISNSGQRISLTDNSQNGATVWVERDAHSTGAPPTTIKGGNVYHERA